MRPHTIDRLGITSSQPRITAGALGGSPSRHRARLTAAERLQALR
jgi:hypothetical protein